MLKKVKLNKIYINTEKNGQPLMTKKSGRPYTMVTIEVGQDKRASMFCDNHYAKNKIETAKTWKEGDEIQLKFEQNGEYLNFDIPSKNDLLEERVAKLEAKVFGN